MYFNLILACSFLLVFIFLIVGLVQCGPLTSSLTLVEQHKIYQTLSEPPNDLKSAYYSVKGIYAIGRTSDEKDFFCNFAADNVDTNDVESLFQFSEISKTLGCKVFS